MKEVGRSYLGDGLYATFDGFQFVLVAPRDGKEHFVALEPEVLEAFHRYIERCCDVTITVTPNWKEDPPEDAA